MNEKVSVKHEVISKNNTRMFVTLAIAGAVLAFAVVSGITLVKRMNYQARVINERSQVEKQLKDNIAAVDTLMESYKAFDTAAESVIGTSDRNSKIVLDALPSKYDFPALATSLEKILVSGGFTSINITGSDNEALAEQNSSSPAPIEIPFTISAQGSYVNIQALISTLQKSIRPFKILRVDFTAGSDASSMNFSITGVTYYQPEKNLDIQTKEVE